MPVAHSTFRLALFANVSNVRFSAVRVFIPRPLAIGQHTRMQQEQISPRGVKVGKEKGKGKFGSSFSGSGEGQKDTQVCGGGCGGFPKFVGVGRVSQLLGRLSWLFTSTPGAHRDVWDGLNVVDTKPGYNIGSLEAGRQKSCFMSVW